MEITQLQTGADAFQKGHRLILEGVRVQVAFLLENSVLDLL